MIESNKQLEEDANDGVAMLKNSHERERKLTEELKEIKKNRMELEKLEKEKNTMKNKFTFVKERLESRAEMFKNKQKKRTRGKTHSVP